MDAIRRVVRIAAVTTLMLAACQSDTAPDLTSGPPDILADEAATCAAEGGRWGPALASSFFVCYRTPADAGRQCSAADDCESHCLARSRTCAPITPFYGCHEVLTEPGKVATLCIQ